MFDGITSSEVMLSCIARSTLSFILASACSPESTLPVPEVFLLLEGPTVVVSVWSFSSSRSRFSISKFETSHSLSILRRIRSRSSALRLNAVICASRCARSSASCRTKVIEPFFAMSCRSLSSSAWCRFPGTASDTFAASSNSAARLGLREGVPTRLPTNDCVLLVTLTPLSCPGDSS
jgi:hypothetical protein